MTYIVKIEGRRSRNFKVPTHAFNYFRNNAKVGDMIGNRKTGNVYRKSI